MNARFSKLRMFSSLALSLTTVSLLFFCGCGGLSHSSPAPVQAQAPAGLTYTLGTAVYIQGVPIAANSPASTGGAVTSYSVTPPLPGGLFLSASTGVISGTAVKAATTTIYTVTASNSGGSTTAPVTITVSLAAPAHLTYSSPTAYYTVGVPIPENAPSSTGGAPTTFGVSPNVTYAYSVTPALPGGLMPVPPSPPAAANTPNAVFASTGVISGTPTSAAATGTYKVTASNLMGSTTTTLTITVSALDADLAPAGLTYSTPAPVYAAGVPIAPNAPSFSAAGGVPTSYSVSPDVTSIGLTLNPSTGILSGTAVAVSSTIVPPPPVTTDYTVTALNAAGSTTAPLSITVYNAPQAVPSMGQSITPLATTGSSFQFLDTGMVITDPIDAQVPPVEWLAGYGASSVVSPDGSTLLVLTSGYNRVFQGPFPLFDPPFSSEYVFIYNIQSGAPVFQQAVPIPNTYHGIVWDPSGTAFYVSGGMGDAPYGTDPVPYPVPNNGDNVHIVTQDPTTHIWALAAELDLGQDPMLGIAAGHPSGNGLPVLDGTFASVNAAVFVAPCAAGVAISNDGQTLVVANYYNDSITVFTGGLASWLGQWNKDDPTLPPVSAQGGEGTKQGVELDLRPGKAIPSPAPGMPAATPGTPGGEYPFGVVVAGSGTNWTAYVSSLRDREIDVVKVEPICTNGTAPPSCDVTPPTVAPVLTARIPVKGQPNKMTLNQAQTLLYVAEDESDTVDVINLGTNTVVESIPVIAPPSVMQSLSLTPYTGANTNSVTLAEPLENYLYVTNGNLNNIAVVALGGTNSGDQVVGLIPTGWYPNSVSLSNGWAYVVNAKSPTGPNPNWCYAYGPSNYPTCTSANEYNPQLTKAGLLSFPLSSAMAQLPALTVDVTTNNRLANTSSTSPVMAAVHAGVQHVIYILKENRTYDQILGDLGRGNGDPTLALFGQAITPNLHNLAQTFVTLDNFRASAEVSYDGWPWSTSARAPDIIEHQYPVNYAQRGLSLDGGTNRSVNVALPTVAERQASNPLFPGGALSPNVPGAEDLLPGQTDTSSPDGPNDEINTGYLWDSALRAGLTVRDYGFFVDTTCYNEPACQTPLAHDPFSTNTIVAPPASVALAPFTDQYFRGFDPSFPDYYRFKEWERDFDANYATGGMANLTLVRFMKDHTGNFGTAIDGVNTPDRDEADNDYAVALLVQKIANSPVYKNNTLIFIVEDDAQDGGDHIDSHRTTAYVAGAYVRDALVSTAYNTIDFIRTMEEVLGLQPMNLNDAVANPMTDVFNATPNLAWTFTATPASILYCTSLPLPQPAQPCNNPTPDAKYWARVTKGMDFTDADRVDGGVFNRILWKGLMGDKPYPAAPTGKDLRQNREKLLADYHRSVTQGAAQKPKTGGD